MATPYEVLGIGPQATRAELEAAYMTQRAAYDPAKVADLGEEFVQLATQRSAELADAYQIIRSALVAPIGLAPAAERRRDRHTMLALVVLVAVAALVPLLRGIAVPVRNVSVDDPKAAALTAKIAPDFTLATLDGKRVSLSEYQGKVVLLNLWASWCPPCIREIPRLQRVYEKYRDQGFVILGINTTYQDDRAKVAQTVQDQGMTYPVLLDEQDVFGQRYAARLLPTSYLVDRNGKIVSVKVGEVDEAQLDEQVRRLLQEQVGAP